MVPSTREVQPEQALAAFCKVRPVWAPLARAVPSRVQVCVVPSAVPPVLAKAMVADATSSDKV